MPGPSSVRGVTWWTLSRFVPPQRRQTANAERDKEEAQRRSRLPGFRCWATREVIVRRRRKAEWSLRGRLTDAKQVGVQHAPRDRNRRRLRLGKWLPTAN